MNLPPKVETFAGWAAAAINIRIVVVSLSAVVGTATAPPPVYPRMKQIAPANPDQ